MQGQYSWEMRQMKLDRITTDPDRMNERPLLDQDSPWIEGLEGPKDRDGMALKTGTKMDTQEIKRMSRIERLQAMEALWDSLIDEEFEIRSPEWHRDILEERRKKIETGKAEFIAIEKLRASRKS
jgi:hypothetical protein